MMRRIGKQILTLLAVAAVFQAGPTRAESVVGAIVTDPLTGVAIEGYDPVSYFTGPRPELGRPDYEYWWAGVPWYFASAANRDIFMRAPEVYAPQHGGHCEMSLARGFLSDGKPQIYVIEGVKLYFFYSAANREAFLISRAQALREAKANWERLSTRLFDPGPELAPGVTAAAESP